MASQAPAADEDLRSLMRSPDYGRPGLAGNRLRAQVRAGYAERYPGPLERDATGRQVDGAVHVRSYERRGDDGRLHTVQAHERGAPPRAAPQQAWVGQPNQTWREQIAHEESRQTAHIDSGYGAIGGGLGRYQLQPGALLDAGWRTSNGQWSERAHAAGISSDAEFLANPAAQKAALSDVMRRNEEQLRANGAWRRIGQQVPGLRGGTVTITEAGLAAAAHRQGAGAVRDYIQHRLRGLPPPPSVRGRGNLSAFNVIEQRLRAYAPTPYERVRR